jgi:hypothetical protein
MKTYTIELQRVKAMANAHGQINVRMDAAVQAQPQRRNDDDAGEPHSVLCMTEETARVMLLLLKAQLAEFDKRKARSQR